MSQQVIFLGYFCIGAIAMALFFLAYGIASSPSQPSSPLGLRGLKRQRVIAQNETWAGIEPLVRWLGIRVSGIMTPSQRAALDEQISLAGEWMGISPEEYLALSLLSGVACVFAGAVAGYLISGVQLAKMLPLILGIIGLFLPYLQISGAAQERLKNISRGLPYAIDLMALAMGAGLDFPGAVRQVVQKSSNPDDPMVEEFTLIMQSLTLGRTRKDALNEFAKRAPVEAVKEFVGSLVQAEERGNPVAEVLQIQATGSRTRRSVRAEELAAKAGVAMVGPLMLVFAAVMMLILGPMYLKMKDGAM
jgi:tight adherence protein C